MTRASSEDVIILGQRRRERLKAIVARASAPQHLVLRSKIVLAAWRGEANAEISRDLDVCEDRPHMAGPVPPGADAGSVRPAPLGSPTGLRDR